MKNIIKRHSLSKINFIIFMMLQMPACDNDALLKKQSLSARVDSAIQTAYKVGDSCSEENEPSISEGGALLICQEGTWNLQNVAEIKNDQVQGVDVIPTFIFEAGIEIDSLEIAATNPDDTILGCYAEPELPEGISLNDPCTLKGTPTNQQELTKYLISGQTILGQIFYKTINIAVSPSLKDTEAAKEAIKIEEKQRKAEFVASVVINQGQAATNVLDVTLYPYAPTATEMYITHSVQCTEGGAWEPIANTKIWALNKPKDNQATYVYAKFRDEQGQESYCIAASIVYDIKAPVPTFIQLNDHDQFILKKEINLGISSRDAEEMYITETKGCASGGEWETYKGTRKFTLSASESGPVSVFIKFRDAAKNESECLEGRGFFINSVISDLTVKNHGTPDMYLQWSPVNGANYYFIYRSLTEKVDTNSSIRHVSTIPSFIDSDLLADTSYFYKVVPVAGVYEGNESNEAFATITADTNAPEPVITGKPVEYSSAASTPISWLGGNDLNIAKFNIKACSDADCSSNCVDSSESFKQSPGLASNLEDGKSYYICVQAEDYAGNKSDWDASSDPVVVDTTRPNPVLVDVPYTFSTSTASVSWSGGEDSNFSTFNLKACSDAKCTKDCLGYGKDTTSPGTIANLLPDSSFYLCVQSLDLAGNVSDWASSPSVTTTFSGLFNNKIDFTSIDSNLYLLGNDPFTAQSHRSELRWFDDEQGNTVISIDTNGDGQSDQDYFLEHMRQNSLTPSDFECCNFNVYTGDATFLLQQKTFTEYSNTAGSLTFNNSIHRRMMGDVNGDGRADIVATHSGTVYVSLATNTGFSAPAEWVSDGATSLVSNLDPKSNPVILGDMNGDGLADLIGFGTTGDSRGVWIRLSDGSKFLPETRWLATGFDTPDGWIVGVHLRFTGDVNGDGRNDIIGFADNGVYYSLSLDNSLATLIEGLAILGSGQGWNPTDHFRGVGDFDGDGRTDVIGISDTSYVALSDGTAFNMQGSWGTPVFNQTWFAASPNRLRMIADVNGDGRDDLIGITDSEVQVAYSTGASFTTPVVMGSFMGTSHGYTSGLADGLNVRLAADYSGDGRADLIGFGYSKVEIALSAGVSPWKRLVSLARPNEGVYGGAEAVSFRILEASPCPPGTTDDHCYWRFEGKALKNKALQNRDVYAWDGAIDGHNPAHGREDYPGTTCDDKTDPRCHFLISGDGRLVSAENPSVGVEGLSSGVYNYLFFRNNCSPGTADQKCLFELRD